MFDVRLTPAVQGHDYAETVELRDDATGDLISATVLDALAYTVTASRYRDLQSVAGTGSATVEDDGLLKITLPKSALDYAVDGALRVTLDYMGDTGSGETSGRLIDAVLPVVPK